VLEWWPAVARAVLRNACWLVLGWSVGDSDGTDSKAPSHARDLTGPRPACCGVSAGGLTQPKAPEAAAGRAQEVSETKNYSSLSLEDSQSSAVETGGEGTLGGRSTASGQTIVLSESRWTVRTCCKLSEGAMV